MGLLLRQCVHHGLPFVNYTHAHTHLQTHAHTVTAVGIKWQYDGWDSDRMALITSTVFTLHLLVDSGEGREKQKRGKKKREIMKGGKEWK